MVGVECVPTLHSPGTGGRARRNPAILGRLPLVVPTWVRAGSPRRWMKRVWLCAPGLGASDAVPTHLWDLRTARSPSLWTWCTIRPTRPGKGCLLGSWTRISTGGRPLSPW